MAKILIVDDDIHWSEAVGNCLKAVNDVKLLPSAHTGGEALNSIHKNLPDLIILDLILPEYDGLYIISCIKKIPDYQPIIYVLTTISTDKINKLIENLNAEYYSVKPIKPEVVVENTITLLKMSGKACKGERAENIRDLRRNGESQ